MRFGIPSGVFLLVVSLWPTASSADPDPGSFRERRAFFEASQVVQQFFLCISDAANADGDLQKRADAEACLRRTLDPDSVFDVNGNLLDGADSVVDLVLGPLSAARSNTLISATSFTVTAFETDRAGTQTIGLATTDIVIQEVVAPSFLFGDVLGPQKLFARDSFRLRRTRRGSWVISSDVARVLSVESQPAMLLLGPFPRFESPRTSD